MGDNRVRPGDAVSVSIPATTDFCNMRNMKLSAHHRSRSGDVTSSPRRKTRRPPALPPSTARRRWGPAGNIRYRRSSQRTYQWLADDTEISGATGSSYTMVAADAGIGDQGEVLHRQ